VSNPIELIASDGHHLSAWLAEPAGPPRGALVVLQEIFGVNSHIRAVTDSFAAEGFLAIAPALFDRVERGVETGYADADVQRGRQLKAGCDNNAALLDIAAAMARVQGAGRIGVVGYCWGGSLAWQAACGLDGLAASVPYYGGGMPEQSGLTPRCPVMAHFGERDAGIPLAGVQAFAKAQPGVAVHLYPAGHGFNCDQRGAFDAAASQLARQRTLEFFHQHGL
jgi:carboxymethylenebutenolidase